MTASCRNSSFTSPILICYCVHLFVHLYNNSFEGDEASRGEFLLVEEPDVMRESLLSAALSYIFLQAAKVRHLVKTERL